MCWIVIPPSVTFIVYGTTVNVSVGRLPFSGVVPGVLGGLVLSLLCWYFAEKRNYPKGEKMTLKEFGPVALACAVAALLTPIIILGGIYSGIFTPTESAAVATAYSLIATRFIYKELDWKTYMRAMRDTTQTTANIMILVMAATCFSWLLTINNVPVLLSSYLLAIVHTKAAFFIGVVLLLTFLECLWMYPLSFL
ncbi:MAG: TRAP transporter large permease subunit [Oscillospiraceae bacterium]